MFCELRIIHSLPCGFMRFQSFLESSRMQSPIVQTLSWCHLELFYKAWLVPWVFPTFSSHFWEFRVLRRQDRWSKLLSVSEPISIFLDSDRLYQFSSILLAIQDLVWLSLEPLSVSSRTTSILQVNFVKPLHESDKFLFESTFQSSPIRSSCNTSRFVQTALVTWMYVSGIENVASFGT